MGLGAAGLPLRARRRGRGQRCGPGRRQRARGPAAVAGQRPGGAAARRHRPIAPAAVPGPDRRRRRPTLGRHRRCRALRRRGRAGPGGARARPGAAARRGRGARVPRRRSGGPADRDPDRPARRLHPGLHGRQPAGPVRCADLRRQPRHNRHGAGDGAADGRGDHRGADRRRLRGRARHHAGQPGDRRPAHARGRPDPVPGRAADDRAYADAALARLLRHAHGHPRRLDRGCHRLRHQPLALRAADAA